MQKETFKLHLLGVSLPIWRVVPEIVVGPLKEHPVKIIESILEAPNVCKVGGVVGWVLVEVHCPRSTTAEIGVSRAGGVAVAAISFAVGGSFMQTQRFPSWSPA